MVDLKRVQAGELISHIWANNLIDSIVQLGERVTALEGGARQSSRVRITAFNPAPPPDGPGQNLGQILQIFGQNFAWPPQKNTVTIQNFSAITGGTVTISATTPNRNPFRPGSSPTLLEFVIPTTISNIMVDGTDVTITVFNGEENASQNYVLLPKLPTVGDPPEFVAPFVTKMDGMTVNLSVNEDAIINGRNFSIEPLNNTITIIIPTSTGEIRYPDPSVAERSQPIEIKSATATQIVFAIPNMREINDEGVDCSLELKVGNFASIERVVNISRG